MTVRELHERKLKRRFDMQEVAPNPYSLECLSKGIARELEFLGSGSKDLDTVLYYGIYSSLSKKFVFGIKEEIPGMAVKKLFRRIGNDARKWRFSVRIIEEADYE